MHDTYKKLSIFGDPNIGFYCVATDKYAITNMLVKEEEFKHILKVPSASTSIANTPFISLFSAANSSKLIVPDIAYKSELAPLKKYAEILTLKTRYTALGNLILVNDNGCIISRLLKSHIKDIKSFLGIPTVVSSIAKLDVVGSAAACTNQGCLVHPKTTEKEIKIIEDILGVKADVGTANFGSPFVKSGLVANSRGMLIGDNSSGPEMARMAEVFGFQ